MSIDAVPKNIGKYTVLGELGRGATSIVYRAKDAFANREVAIKVFNPKGFSSDTERRKFAKLFFKEASFVGKLNHPHIVSVFDAVVEHDDGYIVMEVIKGTPLDLHATPDRLLPLPIVTQIMFKCCSALDFAARQGIIHRDIKPANIIYCDNGEVKITDFGAALSLNVDQTQADGVGSPAYMSPEQISDMPLSHQTDIYSLGVVMYKLLTGRLPFEADSTFALMQKIVTTEPAHIRSLRGDIPEDLARIVHRAIEKDTSRRYANWAELAGDIAGCVMPDTQAVKHIADSEKFGLLKKLPFFADFSEIELWEVLRLSQWAKFPTGKTLMKEGDTGSSFYIITDGEVFVTKMGKMLTSLGKGDCFGEMAYIDKAVSKRSATVICGSPVTLIKIKSDSLAEASDNLQLRFNQAFLRILVRRLAQTNTELAFLVA